MRKKIIVSLLSGILCMSVGNATYYGRSTGPMQPQQMGPNAGMQQGGAYMGMPQGGAYGGMQNSQPPFMQAPQMSQNGYCPALEMKDFTNLLTNGAVVANGVNLKKISINNGGAGKKILSFFGKQKSYTGNFIPTNQVNQRIAQGRIQIDQKTGGTQVPNMGFCEYDHNPGGKAEKLLAAISTAPVQPTPNKGILGQLAHDAKQKIVNRGQNVAQQAANIGYGTAQQGAMVAQQGAMAGHSMAQQGLMDAQNHLQSYDPYMQQSQQPYFNGAQPQPMPSYDSQGYYDQQYPPQGNQYNNYDQDQGQYALDNPQYEPYNNMAPGGDYSQVPGGYEPAYGGNNDGLYSHQDETGGYGAYNNESAQNYTQDQNAYAGQYQNYGEQQYQQPMYNQQYR